MTKDHGTRLITATDMEKLLDYAQSIADEYTPGRKGAASTTIEAWGTRIDKGLRVVWARIAILEEE